MTTPATPQQIAMYTYFDNDGNTITTAEPMPSCVDWGDQNERWDREFDERHDRWKDSHPNATEEEEARAIEDILNEVEKLFA